MGGAAAISVIIPCYNAEGWIGEALQSVLDQDVPTPEIIVVDDGSTDRSAEVVRETFPAVRLARIEKSGVSRARNVGTKMATGQFLQFLDADDLLAAGKLRVQTEALERTGADVAYGDWQEWIPGPGGEFRPGKSVSRQIGEDPEVDLFTDFWCPPATYLFSRRLVELVGGWNESLPVTQDARFALDCALQKGSFVYCPGVMAYYRIHGSGSLSRNNVAEFIRDFLRNAEQVEDWWSGHGGLTVSQRRGLRKVYGYVARGSYRKNPAVFEKALTALERVSPNYCPEEPKGLVLLTRLFGYRHAEEAAFWYRRLKGFMGRENPIA